MPVLNGDVLLGYVVLVHDLSFLARREAPTRQFLLLAFVMLAVGASAVTAGRRTAQRDRLAGSPGATRL